MTTKDHDGFPLDDVSMYANVFSFMGRPLGRDLDAANIDVCVLGIPYDLGTTGRSGARFGPQAIRRASAHLKWEEKRFPWRFCVFDRLHVVDYGDLEFRSGDSEHMLETAEREAGRIVAAGKTLISLGGDHFVTLPLLRAHAKTHGPLALIHFDAHTDTYSQHRRYDHGSMFYHAPREGLVDVARSIQIGIRTEYDPKAHEFEVLSAMEVNEMPADAVIEAIRERVGDRPAYLTFDIDCLDPAFAPGTGTPVAGGLTSGKALHILHGLRDLNTVGYDIVEVAPPYDSAEVTALAGASIALQFLYMHASARL